MHLTGNCSPAILEPVLKKGRIELEYYGDQDLESLLALLRQLHGEEV